MYINGGIHLTDGGVILTKKELKRMVKTHPSRVEFYATSPMGSHFNGTVDNVPDDAVLVVCGPNPESSRRWFANIHKAKDGKLRVT